MDSSLSEISIKAFLNGWMDGLIRYIDGVPRPRSSAGFTVRFGPSSAGKGRRVACGVRVSRVIVTAGRVGDLSTIGWEIFIVSVLESVLPLSISCRISWRLPACDVVQGSHGTYQRWTYVSYVHCGTFNAEIFTTLVVCQGVFQAITWANVKGDSTGGVLNVQASSTAARLKAISGSSGARDEAMLSD